MRPSNISLGHAAEALAREQDGDIKKLTSLKESLIDGRASLKEATATDIRAIEDLTKEAVAGIRHRAEVIDADFGQKIDAIAAHIAAIESAPKGEVIPLQQQAAE